LKCNLKPSKLKYQSIKCIYKKIKEISKKVNLNWLRVSAAPSSCRLCEKEGGRPEGNVAASYSAAWQQ